MGSSNNAISYHLVVFIYIGTDRNEGNRMGSLALTSKDYSIRSTRVRGGFSWHTHSTSLLYLNLVPFWFLHEYSLPNCKDKIRSCVIGCSLVRTSMTGSILVLGEESRLCRYSFAQRDEILGGSVLASTYPRTNVQPFDSLQASNLSGVCVKSTWQTEERVTRDVAGHLRVV